MRACAARSGLIVRNWCSICWDRLAPRRQPRGTCTLWICGSRMRTEAVLGWDIGGAHLKVAAVDGRGTIVRVRSFPCTLWLGLEHLDRAIAAALAGVPRGRLHAL